MQFWEQYHGQSRGQFQRQFQGQFQDNSEYFFELTDKALFQLMEFDAPEHKNNTGHDSKNKGVGEMSVQRQFDEISAEAQGSGCLY